MRLLSIYTTLVSVHFYCKRTYRSWDNVEMIARSHMTTIHHSLVHVLRMLNYDLDVSGKMSSNNHARYNLDMITGSTYTFCDLETAWTFQFSTSHIGLIWT